MFIKNITKIKKAAAKVNGKYGYVKADGKEIIPCVYDNAGFFSEGIACVKENDKHSYKQIPRTRSLP